MPKLAIALHKPLTDILGPSFVYSSVREWTIAACRASSCLVELARDMAQLG
jgi:hypothetical protein